MQLRSLILAILAFSGAAALTQCESVQPLAAEKGEHDPLWPERVPDELDFVADVKPLIETQCLECHNSKDAHKNAGLNLETRQLAMTTGRVPPVIIPGDPKGSLFIKVLKLDPTHPTNMPPAPDKIWGVRLKILEKWIRDGAEWPASAPLIRPQDWDI